MPRRSGVADKDKRFVYVLKNADLAPQFYVGLTSNVGAQLQNEIDGLDAS